MRTLAIASLPNLSLEERLYLFSSPLEVKELLKRGNKREFENLVRWSEIEGNKWVSYGEREYPPQLRSIDEAPFLLTYRGHLSMEGVGLSIVGSQFPSPPSIAIASALARQTSAHGHTVVSSFERGVPFLVHKEALKSWAIVPFGLEHLNHPKVVNYIVEEGGALISEYHPLAPPEHWRYRYSSRLVGALSPVTVVIEARLGSTASITANYALDYGREVVVAMAGLEGASKALYEAGAPLITSLDEISQLTQIEYGRL